VRRTLEKIPGVKSVTVDLDAAEAVVEAPGVPAATMVAAVNAVDGGGRFTAKAK
jgi:copper chaperone CopZ